VLGGRRPPEDCTSRGLAYRASPDARIPGQCERGERKEAGDSQGALPRSCCPMPQHRAHPRIVAQPVREAIGHTPSLLAAADRVPRWTASSPLGLARVFVSLPTFPPDLDYGLNHMPEKNGTGHAGENKRNPSTGPEPDPGAEGRSDGASDEQFPGAVRHGPSRWRRVRPSLPAYPPARTGEDRPPARVRDTGGRSLRAHRSANHSIPQTAPATTPRTK
jgi:hypothetical protein